jgi:hypothetical protein
MSRLHVLAVVLMVAGLALSGCATAGGPPAVGVNATAVRPYGPAGAAPGGTHGPAGTAPAGTHGPAGATPAATAGTGRSGHAGRPGGGVLAAFCPARPAPALTADLSRAVATSLRAEVIPLGISADGRTAYVSAWTSAFAGVAALNLATGALRPIRSFGDPSADQADGAWGGRWLVWDETYSLQSLDTFTVFGWDSVTGRLVRLGHSLTSAAGTPWPSPWHAPAVSGHFAAWAQGYGPGGLVQIRLADLRTGAVTVIRQGHVQAPFFDGGLLVWPESDSPGSPTTLRSYSLATARLAPLPAVLRAVRGTDFVATDGTRTAYLSPDLTAMYYSPAPDRGARMVLRLPPGVEFAYLAMAPGALAWTTTKATYLASTSTGGYSAVTPRYGFAVTGQGPAVLVSDAPASAAPHPILALHVVNVSAAGWPRCS